MKDQARNSLWLASIGLAVLGFIDSIYLTWVKVAGAKAACAGVGDCESVNNSIYSEIGGIPIAVLGAGAYLAIILVGLLELHVPAWKEALILATFGMSLVGTLYSVYLTYIEVAVLHAICPYCVVSAVLITALLVISALRVREHGLDDDPDWAEELGTSA